jgi:hypothetical protein
VVFLDVLDDLLFDVSIAILSNPNQLCGFQDASTYRFGNEISDAHIFAEESPDFCAADVVLDCLAKVSLEVVNGIPEIRT